MRVLMDMNSQKAFLFRQGASSRRLILRKAHWHTKKPVGREPAGYGRRHRFPCGIRRKIHRAENPSAPGTSKASGEFQEVMRKQIAELRREITKTNRTLSERAQEPAGWYDCSAEQVSGAAPQLRSQAHTMSEKVQRNTRCDLVGNGARRHAWRSSRHRNCQEFRARTPLVLEAEPTPPGISTQAKALAATEQRTAVRRARGSRNQALVNRLIKR